MSAPRDLTGHTFDWLTVIARGPDDCRRVAHWWCLCVCGNLRLVNRNNLLRRHTRSCGCLRKAVTRERNFRHGKTHTAEYGIWIGMKDRCLNPQDRAYPHYGGRGITVCKRWQDSFESFLADMGPRPSPRHSLDRYPDQKGLYSPENCRWATRTEQGRNRHDNRMLTYQGKTQCVAAWAEELHIKAYTIRRRSLAGWSDKDALTIPIDPGRKHLRNLTVVQGVEA